jgi:hypothetical protein
VPRDFPCLPARGLGVFGHTPLDRVRILLQESSSRKYFSYQCKWTENTVEARDFLSTVTAYDYAREHALEGVNIVLQSDTGMGEIVIPIPPAKRAKGFDGY